ncbi:sensor histidine kinase [Sphingobacterium sp. N143]|uniref:ATP-binding protein n=1 Tax=Sphingobacterium sp. N143 TaxID=2746727 RepID=UPI002576D441|nr:sensor histidine kinase [Sphingobacterium sp. N143]MDM1296689.1 sensor histidine kinase [Sphingobacterium sp. N143]
MKFLLIILFFSCTLANAQIVVKLYEDSSYIQKLQDRFTLAKNDSSKSYAALQLASAYKRVKNLPKAKEYLEKGTSLSGNIPFLKGASLYYRAYIMMGAQDLNMIRSYSTEADKILSRYDNSEAYRLRSHNWVLRGVLEQMQGNEKQGLDAYINHALPLSIRSKDTFTIANANKFVGISLLNAEQRPKANKYLTDALVNFERSTTDHKAQREGALVEVLLVLAENSLFMDRPDQGKLYLDRAYTILKKYPSSNAFLFYYFPEGLYYEKKERYENAITSYDKGIAIQADVGENYYINRAKYAKFNILRKLGRNQQAIAVMEDLLRSNILLINDRNSYYNLLAQTYAHTGNMKEAYTWSQKFISINDSLHTSQNRADIVEMEKKYQTAKKERQISQLQAERKEAELTEKNHRLLNWLLGIGAAIFLLAFIFAVYIYRTKQQQTSTRLQELEKQKELELTQAVLLAEERERARIARDLHDGLGGTLSGIKIKLSAERKNASSSVIDDTVRQLENSIGELRRISRNMMPETLIRSGLEVALRDLCVSISSDNILVEFQPSGIKDTIPVQVQVNIYRVIQELLNNSLRHGKATKIIVQCIQEKNNILITVEDNGSGFDPKAQEQVNGIGLVNIKNRVNLMKGTIQIDSTIDEGTTVNIEIYV